MESNFQAHIRMLVRMALSDQNFSSIERGLILSIGKAHSVKEEELNQIIEEELNKEQIPNIEFQALTFDEKFEYIYDIIQLMKIDNEVYLSEIKYCEEMAEKLGFEKKVVKKLSARIYSDPAITSDREQMKKVARKHLRE
ncbi:MAG: TerB family tellurite resistance protein [Bacteroidota bacterium]